MSKRKINVFNLHSNYQKIVYKIKFELYLSIRSKGANIFVNISYFYEYPALFKKNAKIKKHQMVTTLQELLY